MSHSIGIDWSKAQRSESEKERKVKKRKNR